MTGNSKLSFVCNQVLRVIKESDLNYLVKETPYSAYITIRKKFVKNREVHEASGIATSVDDLPLSDIVLRQENISLRQKFNDFERDRCHLTIKNEELDLKVESLSKNISDLESENKSLKIRLEVAKGQTSNSIDKFETQSKVIQDIEDEKTSMIVQIKESKSKMAKLEKELKDKDDYLLISESTIKNRDACIDELKNEMDVLKAERFLHCDECEYTSEIETDLKCHTKDDHIHKCPHCDNNFVGEKKLRKHSAENT